jgi:hypothetical protein
MIGNECPFPPPPPLPPPPPPSPSPPPPGPPSNQGALLAIKYAAGDSWGLDDWQDGSDPCGEYSWTGVTCTDGQVTAIDLSYQGLSVSPSAAAP